MLGGFGIIDPTDIRSSTRTTTGTLITIPAGKFFTGNVLLSAQLTAAGTSQPVVTVAGTSSTPASGSTIARINVGGLLAVAISDTGETEVLVYADSEDVTLEFTAGASGTSSCSVNGFIFG